MKIIIASDHRGFDRKIKIFKFLLGKGYDVDDYGTNSIESVDYPEYAFKVAQSIKNMEADLGILICGTGIGMSIAANRIKGVRCAKIDSINDARLSKEHNNANVLAISANKSMRQIKKMLEAYFNSEVNTDIKYQRRNDMLDNYNEN